MFKAIMLMISKKKQIISGPQTVTVTVLNNMEVPFGTDNYYKGIYTAPLMYKIFQFEHFAA
jgi:hypothetical protein